MIVKDVGLELLVVWLLCFLVSGIQEYVVQFVNEVQDIIDVNIVLVGVYEILVEVFGDNVGL